MAPVERGQQLQIRSAGQVRIELWLLDEAGNPGQCCERIGGRVAAEQADRAGVPADQAEQHAQGCRLSGPVRAEEAVDVAALHRQIHLVDGGQATVSFDEASNLYRPQFAYVKLGHGGQILGDGI